MLLSTAKEPQLLVVRWPVARCGPRGECSHHSQTGFACTKSKMKHQSTHPASLIFTEFPDMRQPEDSSLWPERYVTMRIRNKVSILASGWAIS